jgi:hypothetical protein
MKKFACLLAFICLAWGNSARADEFQKVRCDSDIPKALIGQRLSNQPVVVAEKKYLALGLRDLGGDEISDRLSASEWEICGADFLLLVDSKHIRDVLPFPPHSRQSPASLGFCQVRGGGFTDIFFAILDGAPATESLPAQVAWKIDQQHAKFVKASTEGLTCPRSGIYGADRDD